MSNFLLIGVLGLMGIFCRYGVDLVFSTGSRDFPVATFAINILGSFLAGLIYAIGETREISPAWQTALLVGFCGGFTTFSAYALQSLTLLDKGKTLTALIYFSVSPVLGLTAAFIPVIILRKVSGSF